MEIEWTPSADKRGIPRADQAFAILNSLYKRTPMETSRERPGAVVDLYIGPQRDPNAPLLEVMVERFGSRARIFHCMEARAKFLTRFTKGDWS